VEHLADGGEVAGTRIGDDGEARGHGAGALSVKIQPPFVTARLIDVAVAGLTVSLGSSAAPAMSDASFDAETTQLALRARAGDREAFSALVTLHHRAATRVAAAALSGHADAEEAVQDACITAWRSIGQLDDPSAFRSWLLRITWRKAIDRRRSIGSWLRRIQREHHDADPLLASVPTSSPTPDGELLARERDRVIAQMIRSLPARLRDPFLLAAAGEHRYEDIARMLAVPIGTVKWRISEARRVLRDKLTRIGFGDLS
jgi:RNA polymerase sigma-70 factor (ECF subfamily)